MPCENDHNILEDPVLILDILVVQPSSRNENHEAIVHYSEVTQASENLVPNSDGAHLAADWSLNVLGEGLSRDEHDQEVRNDSEQNCKREETNEEDNIAELDHKGRVNQLDVVTVVNHYS